MGKGMYILLAFLIIIFVSLMAYLIINNQTEEIVDNTNVENDEIDQENIFINETNVTDVVVKEDNNESEDNITETNESELSDNLSMNYSDLGISLPPNTLCADSDLENPDRRGQVNTTIGIFNDTCILDNTMVREYICVNNQEQYEDYFCSVGCFDGACVVNSSG